MTLRLLLLKALRPVTIFLGKIHAPDSHKLIVSADLLTLLPLIKPGQILISHIKGELSNVLIPGFYSHAAIVSRIADEGGYKIPMVIEAVGKGVREVDLMSFMFSKDEVALLEPTFATVGQMEKAGELCSHYVGVAYDYYFEPGDKAFYCSELIQAAYNSILGHEMPFTKRTTLGVSTVVPQDYFDAKDKFHVLWLSGAPSAAVKG